MPLTTQNKKRRRLNGFHEINIEQYTRDGNVQPEPIEHQVAANSNTEFPCAFQPKTHTCLFILLMSYLMSFKDIRIINKVTA